MLEIYLQGLILGFSLIVAIGAQNAVVMRNGVQGIYPFWTASVCALADILLIAVGVGGLGIIISQNTLLMNLAKWGGFGYLLWMSFASFHACFKAEVLLTQKIGSKVSFKSAMTTVLMVTFLNPHVYLDTVILLGSIGSQFPEHLRIYFAMGTMTAGAVWFFSLSMAAKMFAPILSNPGAWRILNGIIGLILIYVAVSILKL